MIATARRADPITRGDQASRTISPLRNALHRATALTRRARRSFPPADFSNQLISIFSPRPLEAVKLIADEEVRGTSEPNATASTPGTSVTRLSNSRGDTTASGCVSELASEDATGTKLGRLTLHRQPVRRIVAQPDADYVLQAADEQTRADCQKRGESDFRNHQNVAEAQFRHQVLLSRRRHSPGS